MYHISVVMQLSISKLCIP